MIDCLIDWLKVSEIRNFLKVKWEGIKGLSQTFILLLWSPWIQILFITKPSREDDMTSSIYLNEKGCWKYLNFIWKYFPFLKLYATQWFSREKIKWLLQNIWNMSWEFQRIKFKVLLEIIFNLELFGFYSNYFSPKIKYMENRVTWFPTIENWRKIYLKSFWYFKKMIFVGF